MKDVMTARLDSIVVRQTVIRTDMMIQDVGGVLRISSSSKVVFPVELLTIFADDFFLKKASMLSVLLAYRNLFI
jgi:hypothetical protein